MFLLFGGFACSGDSGGGSGGSGTGGSAPGTTTASTGTGAGGVEMLFACLSDDGPTNCTVPESPGPGTAISVAAVTGTILDLTGAPVSDIMTDVCGSNICLAGHSDSDGSFEIMGSGTDLIDPHFIYGNGRGYVKFAMPFTGLPNADIGTVYAVELPDFSAGETICPGETISQGPASITLAESITVKHDLLLYSADETKYGFRSVAIPLDGAGGAGGGSSASSKHPAIDASLNFSIVVGTAPLNTRFCPSVKMTIQNSAGLAADATVEFFLHGTVTLSTAYATYGNWAKVSEGKVSSDGTTVSTNDGEGIPELGLIGVRLKP